MFYKKQPHRNTTAPGGYEGDIVTLLPQFVDFNRQIVYMLRFLTHAQYSKDRWKETL